MPWTTPTDRPDGYVLGSFLQPLTEPQVLRLLCTSNHGHCTYSDSESVHLHRIKSRGHQSAANQDHSPQHALDWKLKVCLDRLQLYKASKEFNKHDCHKVYFLLLKASRNKESCLIITRVCSQHNKRDVLRKCSHVPIQTLAKLMATTNVR